MPGERATGVLGDPGAPDPLSVPWISTLQSSYPQRRAAFLLPFRGRACLDGCWEPSSAWLWSLHVAEEDLPAASLGAGADGDPRASCSAFEAWIPSFYSHKPK